MASEKSLRQVVDSVLVTPDFAIESLASETSGYKTKLRQLIKLKNIVGIGISDKVSKRKRTGKIGLTFYVEKKVDIKDLKPEEIIPKTFLTSLNGKKTIITDVVEIGKIVPQANVTRGKIQPGFSIGHSQAGLGTIGAIVTDGKQKFILSNSHVLALNGLAKKGDAIVYPGGEDGGKAPKDVVARLHQFKKFIKTTKFVNEVDCAIALPTKEREADIVVAIKNLGLPKGVIEPKRGMKVIKVGRSTGKTRSEILDAYFHTKIEYDGVGEIGFVHQVLCKRFTESGDSGSLVIDVATGKAVGLHFAGGAKGSVFNRIQKVLDSLNVKLITK